MESSQLLVALVTAMLALLVPITLYPKRTYHWVMRKNYQYEITIGSYLMTPTEKVILSEYSICPKLFRMALSPSYYRYMSLLTIATDTILFLSLSLVFFAIVLYLPSHISTMTHRAFYYLSGHKSGLFTAPSCASSALISSTSAAWTSATEALQRATESVAHTLVQSVTAAREEMAKTSSKVPVGPGKGANQQEIL